jgi:hypothetical protein
VILIAVSVLLTPSVDRLIGGPSPILALAVYAVSDLLVVAVIVYDLATRRRVHASFARAGLALVTTQFQQKATRHTDVGRAIMACLQS